MSTTQWMLDKAHSEVQFKAKNLLITTVKMNLRILMPL